SVSIEEQFYLCWPFVMRRWMNHLAIVALALLAVSFIARIWLVIHGAVHPQIWCNTLARLDPIACGALLAVRAERKEINFSPWIRVILLLLGCLLLTAAGRYGDFIGIKALITFPIVSAACVMLILATLGWRLRRGPRSSVRVLMYLGRISYGLYVFHWMFVLIFNVPSTHGPVARPIRAVAALLATVGTAALSYHFFEKPFLRLKEKFARIPSAVLGF
ncbi:MAG TPA: acyltransferase, partial [Steroidobacteraceae bacterium]